MAEDDEWNFRAPAEGLPVKPEQLDRFRRLLTELMFCLAGLPVFSLAATCIKPPLRIPPSPRTSLPPLPEWEILFYRWTPLVLLGLAFTCLVWLVVVLLRMAELKTRRE
ncbi:hypothetical protein OKA05_12070 [Luteolibacter arcticus]|uniref:Transmembrane protein n=1 Tax=Luteolibacter arcticus TaxID=1581411 RepID=A0ABT3GIF2_9BACT|nr:hypothetical protein [Luteolibacter arcticus]MCW1923292.1 hypothetical protein [Luteolibacter arcticus]